jgi:hypothetical protein
LKNKRSTVCPFEEQKKHSMPVWRAKEAQYARLKSKKAHYVSFKSKEAQLASLKSNCFF